MALCHIYAKKSKLPQLNPICKIVDNGCPILRVVRLNFFSGDCLQCINSARMVQVDVIFEEPPEGEIWVGVGLMSEVPIQL